MFSLCTMKILPVFTHQLTDRGTKTQGILFSFSFYANWQLKEEGPVCVTALELLKGQQAKMLGM